MKKEKKLSTHYNLIDAFPRKAWERKKNYYRFSGSLTTPPCSEGVRWLVLKEHREISAGQIDKFINVMMKGRNNRPVQPLDARKVMKNR